MQNLPVRITGRESARPSENCHRFSATWRVEIHDGLIERWVAFQFHFLKDRPSGIPNRAGHPGLWRPTQDRSLAQQAVWTDFSRCDVQLPAVRPVTGECRGEVREWALGKWRC